MKLQLRPYYLKHDLGSHEGLLAHDDHVAVWQPDAVLGEGGILPGFGVVGCNLTILLLKSSENC